jgi:hypothetical protein
MNSLRVQQQTTIATVGGSDNENDARCVVCALGMSFFFFVFFYVLINDLFSI